VRRNVALVGIGIGLAVVVVALTLAARLGLVTLSIGRPDGHAFWLFSRAAGITAYVALTAVTVWGLLLSTAVADSIISRGRSLDAHRWLSAAALALSVAHAVALIGDKYISFDILDVIVPFLSAYRPEAVGAGIVALYLSIAVFGSFWLRGYIGQRGWRAIHFLSFPAFGLVTLHGLFAGTDSGSPWVWGMYLLATALVGLLTVVRVLGVAGSGKQQMPVRAAA